MPLNQADLEAVDFRAVFEKSIALQLLLDPSFIIVAVTDAYAKATMTEREQIVGRHLFEVFPDNPDGARGLRDQAAACEDIPRRL